MNVLVCNAAVPFVRGGAELLAEGLLAALREQGHRADLVALPFQWLPKTKVLKSALAWRLLDIRQSNGIRVERVIATKFPSYAVRHPHKVVWLVHQFRQAYDWYGTPLSDFTSAPEDRQLRARILETDRRMMGEAQARYAISRNVAARLERFTGLTAEPLYPPPRLAGRFRSEEPGDYIFFVGRLDRAKRVDLFVRALRQAPRARAVIAGAGPEADALRALAEGQGVAARVQFPGVVSDETLLDLYARARAVYYAPVDEDYGFVTVEAFASARPVITTDDAGGVLEFVEHGRTGLVCAPDPSAIAAALARVYAEPEQARLWGRAGRECIAGITWPNVVERLLA